MVHKKGESEMNKTKEEIISRTSELLWEAYDLISDVLQEVDNHNDDFLKEIRWLIFDLKYKGIRPIAEKLNKEKINNIHKKN